MSCCPVTSEEWARFDRIRDLHDAYALGDIRREEFLRSIQELHIDWYEANWIANQIKQQAAE